jgi:cobyrinic acid a,c-diamide synthase
MMWERAGSLILALPQVRLGAMAPGLELYPEGEGARKLGRAVPGIVVAGLRGGSGKTLVTMGLLVALKEMGKSVVPFKKGPDYIDAAWLAMASGRDCYNLDPYLMSVDQMLASYCRRCQGKELALVEGNRGLFDGVDEHGTYSTAELAKILRLPVVVVVDATKTTRTAAAMVLGLRSLDPEVMIKGVILNQVAGSRHERVVRKAIEGYSGVRVIGAVPRMHGLNFPERHLGLVPPAERGRGEELAQRIGETVRAHVDLDGLLGIAASAGEIPDVHLYRKNKHSRGVMGRIGVFRDRAFHFYYPENLDSLKEEGLEPVWINAIEDRALPPVDGLYIGGGFPEVFAEALSENASLRKDIRTAWEDGLPIYAECGGLMYLGEEIEVKGNSYPMVGVLPLRTEFMERPQGHGYTLLEAVGENPFVPKGVLIKGHEFHYSRIVRLQEEKVRFAFQVKRGNGLEGKREGIVRKNLLATYTHIHSISCENWGQWIRSGIAEARRHERARSRVLAH